MKSTHPDDYQYVDRPIAAMPKDFPAGYRTALHAHARAQLIFAASGVMEITAGDSIWIVPTGRAIWMPAGTTHRVTMIGAVAMRTLYIDPALDTELGAACQVVAISSLLRQLILAAMAIPLEYDCRGRDGTVMQLIVHELESVDVVPLHAPMPRDARLRRICQAILDDPACADTLDQWGARVGATARTLANHFRAQTGLTFGRWRQQARLIEAVRRLAAGQSVATVALDLGYRSESAFIAMFRRALGETPGQYCGPLHSHK